MESFRSPVFKCPVETLIESDEVNEQCCCKDDECDEAADKQRAIAIASFCISKCENAKENRESEEADPYKWR